MTKHNPPAVAGETKNKSLGLAFNWQDWLPYFEDTDIPEAQKRELAETLWQIVVAFVDLGFELNPHQQAHQPSGQESCGQTLDLKALLEAAVLKSATAKCADEQAYCLPKQPKQPKQPKP